jgi:hypothetical protein
MEKTTVELIVGSGGTGKLVIQYRPRYDQFFDDGIF